jgi:hypothetical protein
MPIYVADEAQINKNPVALRRVQQQRCAQFTHWPDLDPGRERLNELGDSINKAFIPWSPLIPVRE